MENIIYSAGGGKSAINPSAVFVNYVKLENIKDDTKISDCLSGIKNYVIDIANKAGVTISDGSFNKCNGDWYEWFIAIRAIEFFCKNRTPRLLVSMPNKTSFDVISLYKEDLSYYIYDLTEKLNENSVNLITSNPDFVILNISDIDSYVSMLSSICFDNISMSMLSDVDILYKNFIGYGDIDSIYGYLSVKTTFRPDRRLQLAHEGSLMKALYTHLQTRTWTISGSVIKYYGAATSVGAADIEGLKTVATHSITDVKSLPQSAVDEVFRINSFVEIDQCLSTLLV